MDRQIVGANKPGQSLCCSLSVFVLCCCACLAAIIQALSATITSFSELSFFWVFDFELLFCFFFFGLKLRLCTRGCVICFQRDSFLGEVPKKMNINSWFGRT